MSTTITTAEDALTAIQRVVKSHALNNVAHIKTELGWVKTALNNAIEAIEAIDGLAYITALTESDIRALYSLTGSISVLVQEARSLATAGGRIEADLNVLAAIK